MGDNENPGPKAFHFSSTVAPAAASEMQQLYPTLPLDELQPTTTAGTKFSDNFIQQLSD